MAPQKHRGGWPVVPGASIAAAVRVRSGDGLRPLSASPVAPCSVDGGPAAPAFRGGRAAAGGWAAHGGHPYPRTADLRPFGGSLPAHRRLTALRG